MTHKEDRKDERRAGDAIAALATGQHGVISRAQARALGLTDTMIASRLAAGIFQPVFRGVFAVGHRAFGRHGHMCAAVLACGDGAVVSHMTAAELLGLWDRQPVLIDVIAPGKRGCRIDGLRWHLGHPLAPDEVTVRDRVPCTTVSRTLVDMAGSVGEQSLRRLIEQAAVRRALDVAEIDRLLARKRRRGAPMLRRAVAPWQLDEASPPVLRSVLEAPLLAAIVEEGLPRPRCNVALWLGGRRIEVDFLWEAQRLVVETDGERAHGTSAAFQRDRWRDQVLGAEGYRVVRVTWQQIAGERDATLARLRRALAPSA
jgi:predicted transcriptional regulator of viral defense system